MRFSDTVGIQIPYIGITGTFELQSFTFPAIQMGGVENILPVPCSRGIKQNKNENELVSGLRSHTTVTSLLSIYLG